MNLAPEDFINAGYNQFKDSFKEHASFGLQKKVTDGEGLKYFITLYAYDLSQFKFVDWKWNFETEIHFQTDDGYIRLYFRVKDIQKAENRVEKLWEYFGKPYISKNGE